MSKRSKKSIKSNDDSFFRKSWNNVKKFWDFLWNDDSLLSYVLNFALAFIFIKYLFFPGLGLVLHNDYPVVAIVSGSMEHKIVKNYDSSGNSLPFVSICDKNFADFSLKGSVNFDNWWGYCGDYYEKNYNLTKTDFESYPYQNGLNIGDVMVLYGEEPKDIEVGEVLVFVPNSREFFEQMGPVIHRVVQKWQDEDGKYHFRTKGDHNGQSFDNFEEDISEDQVIAVAKFRVPFIGYAKLALTNSINGIRGLLN